MTPPAESSWVGGPRPIDREAETVLAERLADRPTTFGARCVLMRHVGAAWVRGPLEAPRAVIVRDRWAADEPDVLGDDPEEIWKLLRELPGWRGVHCTTELARGLAPVLERELGRPIELRDDIYHTLEGPATRYPHPDVRRLTEDDAELIERSPPELSPIGFDSTLAALSGGVVAGAVVGGQLRARTSMTLSSEGHADIGSHTLVGWRGRGYASAALSLVASEVRGRGLLPVWSCGGDDLASRRVAFKVGFRECGRRAYVVVPAFEDTAGLRPA